MSATLHSLRHNLDPHEKLQGYKSLRAHFAMRFARQYSRNHPQSMPPFTLFPIIVNNQLRSFGS